MASLTSISWSLLLAVFSVVNTDSAPALYRPVNAPELWLELWTLNISNECKKEFQSLIFNKTEDLAKALDAFGRPEAGILEENWNWFGHFPECTSLKGLKFCLLAVDINASHLTTIREDRIPVHWGMCIPKKCSTEDVRESALSMLGNLNLQQSIYDAIYVSGVDYCVEDPVVPYNAGFYASIVVFTFLGLLAISGSIVEVIERRLLRKDNAENYPTLELSPLMQNEGSEPTESNPTGLKMPSSDATCCSNIINKFVCGVRFLLLDFAFNRNLGRLLHVGESTDQDINCLNGIRVFSILWIILGHTLHKPLRDGGLYNPVHAYSRNSGIFYQAFVGNFHFAVDSFFFMSGLLVCFNTLGKLEKNSGLLKWYLFYLHRIIRLLPMLVYSLFIYMFIMPHLMRGPRAPYFADQRSCEAYWWTTMLFINNIYPNMDDLCMKWTWYLANDMQFFALSPLFIYALFRNPLMGFGLLSLLMSICMGATGFLVAYDDFTLPLANAVRNPATDLIYRAPFVRVSPYLVGLLVGFVLFKCKANKTTFPKVFFYLGWIIATCVFGAILFGVNIKRPMGIVGSVLYEMFNHVSWGICLSWVVLACRFGGSGWINDILSWKFWVPLSRVTYAVYLLHPILIIVLAGNLVRPFYDSIILKVYYFGATVFFSYVLAMVISLVVEIPAVNIERRLLPTK